MVTLEVETDRREGVTLVEGQVENDGPDPRRVTVASELDPVLPPRREGVPEAGWDREEGRLTLVVGPGERVGFGFASPAPPVDPPARVVESERAVADGGIDSPAGVVRALGDPSPPRDVLPTPPGPAVGRRDDGPNEGTDCDGGEGRDAGTDPKRSPGSDSLVGGDLPGDVEADLPAVAAWLAAVERRIVRSGGEDHTGDGSDRLRSDARQLRAVSRRATALADRAASADAEAGDPGGGDPAARKGSAGDRG